MRAGHVPVRGELVPGPDSFEAEVLDADPRRVKRINIYRRNDRRPALLRETSAPPKSAPPRPAAPREDSTRPSPNTAQSP
jgi:anti-sigma factor RsiW